VFFTESKLLQAILASYPVNPGNVKKVIGGVYFLAQSAHRIFTKFIERKKTLE
jgi:hypothetical protein